MKTSTIVGIIIFDIILVGLALLTSGVFSATYGSGLWSFAGQSSSTSTFANGTSITLTKVVREPTPQMFTVGLWTLFSGVLLALDYVFATARSLGKSLNRAFNHRLTWSVLRPYTPEEIAVEKEVFAIRLQKLSERIAQEEAEENKKT